MLIKLTRYDTGDEILINTDSILCCQIVNVVGMVLTDVTYHRGDWCVRVIESLDKIIKLQKGNTK